jgi:hypothetical protein
LCAAGLFLGAVTGGLIGLATESGLFRGTGIGAITGALVSIEVVDSSIRVWQSRRSGIWSILYVVSTLLMILHQTLLCGCVCSNYCSILSSVDQHFVFFFFLKKNRGTNPSVSV